jgi:hypothetical protein
MTMAWKSRNWKKWSESEKGSAAGCAAFVSNPLHKNAIAVAIASGATGIALLAASWNLDESRLREALSAAGYTVG